MLHIKYLGHRPFGSREEDFFKVFAMAEAIRTTVVPIRILIRTTVVPIRILIRTTECDCRSV